MSNFTVSPSYAGTGQKYINAQVRVKDGRINLQIPGPKNNRDYGAAGSFSVSEEFLDFLGEVSQNFVRPSLAGTLQNYIPVQLRLREDGVHVQVNHYGAPSEAANRSYGFAETLHGRPEWLTEYLKTA